MTKKRCWNLTLSVSLAFLAAGTIGESNACIWDRDTLAQEAKANPGFTEVITGRFERFPDRYYEMRLERVAKELETSPERLDLYDDAGAAADRLHRGEEAIEWMAKKKAVLDRSKSDDTDHLYRYHANLGTFLFHHWMRSGADVSEIELAKEGREHIAEAIRINPDAHFGREKVQLVAMDWIIAEQQAGTKPLALALRDDRMSLEEISEGLIGLVRLGDAWRSVDIFGALALTLQDQMETSLAILAELRILELLKSGVSGFDPGLTSEYVNDSSARFRIDGSTDHLDDWFESARDEADAWNDARFRYMETKFSAGDHPDTHSDFWTGFTYAGVAPSMPDDRKSAFFDRNKELLVRTLSFAIGLGILLVCLRLSVGFLRWIFRSNSSG